MNKPIALFFAGTNGSGKTTIRGDLHGMPVIDPDAIAREINQGNPREVDFEAGKRAILLFNTYISEMTSFIMETTLTGNSALNRIKSVKKAGFNVILNYVGLDSPDLNVLRVAERVAHGGHHIDEDVIRNRYTVCLQNLLKAIPYTDSTCIIDNSTDKLRICALIENNRIDLNSIEHPSWVTTVLAQLKNQI